MIKKLSIFVVVFGMFSLLAAENLFSTDPNAKTYTSDLLTVVSNSDFSRSEDTIHYDGPNAANGIGLTSGGTFWGAVRYTTTNACTLKSAIFFNYGNVSAPGWIYIHAAGSATVPGAKLDSASYTGATGTWVRVNFANPVLISPGADFWLNVKLTHVTGQYPFGVDAGPAVVPYRSFVSTNGTSWQSLGGDIPTLSYNWNLRAIVKFLSIADDVGVDAIIAPTTSHRINMPMIPIAKVKNYGTNAQTNFEVICSIVGPGNVYRYSNVQNITSLGAGDTVRVNFASWTPNIAEQLTVIMKTDLIGDANPANDRSTQTTNVTSALLSEGFNDIAFPPAGWQAIPLIGTYNWGRYATGTNPTCTPFEGAGMAGYPCYTATTGSARLISPAVALGSTAVPCTLKFNMYHDDQYPGGQYGPDSVKVESSVNGTSFTRVAAFMRYGPVNQWEEHVVYLGSFSGNFWLGLLAFSQYGDNIFIDNVRLYSPSAGIEENGNSNIYVTALNSVKPNPVSGNAYISFNIAKPTSASLRIYDASGRVIRTLINGHYNTGTHNLVWNGKDDNDRAVAEGVYFYTLETDNHSSTKKLVLTR
jgi:hypothetical protein